MDSTAALLIDVRCQLGEGVLWWRDRAALLWTDISASTLWIHTSADRVHRAIALPDRLGSFAICASGRLLLALAKQICVADLNGDGPVTIARVTEIEPGLATTRANDGRTDRSGNFVFGTMDEDPAEARIGGFYQFSMRRGLRRLALDPVAIANSICFSVDGRTMYFCDSPQRRILQADYDAADARVENVRVFADFQAHQGMPDGSVVDSQGCLWNAEWGTGIVRCYSPEGRIEREIRVPSKNPTCVAFGGPTLEELFITTARQDHDEGELSATPEAGGVFCARPGAQGVLDEPFADTHPANT